MIDNDDLKSDKWSYYLEMLKSPVIEKADKDNPTLGLKDHLLNDIKENKIPESKDIRKVVKMAKLKDDAGFEALSSYADGTFSLEEAFSLVEDVSKASDALSKAKIFLNMLSKKNFASIVKENPELKYVLKQIENVIHNQK